MLAAALKHLVSGIVDHPESVTVVAKSTPRGDLLEVSVHPDDLGRVIGRRGRTAQSIRTVVRAAAANDDVDVDVDFVDA